MEDVELTGSEVISLQVLLDVEFAKFIIKDCKLKP